MADITYSSEQVTKALLTLAAHGGNAQAACEILHDDDFMVSEATLLLWKHETHAERYQRMERELASERERQTVSVLQETITETSRIKKDLLEKVQETANKPEYAGHALRAITDAESKSVNSLLALTGRPTDGRQEGGQDAMARLVIGMAERGLIKLADGLSMEPKRVANEAEQG